MRAHYLRSYLRFLPGAHPPPTHPYPAPKSTSFRSSRAWTEGRRHSQATEVLNAEWVLPLPPGPAPQPGRHPPPPPPTIVRGISTADLLFHPEHPNQMPRCSHPHLPLSSRPRPLFTVYPCVGVCSWCDGVRVLGIIPPEFAANPRRTKNKRKRAAGEEVRGWCWGVGHHNKRRQVQLCAGTGLPTIRVYVCVSERMALWPSQNGALSAFPVSMCALFWSHTHA